MDMSVINSEFEKSLIEAISRGLPLVSRPYELIARQIGSTEARVIEGIQRIIQSGDVKRFGVVVRHRELGYRANGMVVWDMPDERIHELGKCIGRYDFVTLCYQRPRRFPGWPYNLFSMIHGRDPGNVRAQVDFIVEQCGLQKIAHEILFSGRCFKQRGANYAPKRPEKSNNQYGMAVNG